MEITFREVLVSIAIVLISLIGGFFIATKIHDAIITRNDVYFKALKVDNDSEIFTYAINTEVGNILSEGEFVADKPVTDSQIEGEYTLIEKVKEEYTMHTRTVSYECGKGTCTRLETYWTWDVVDVEEFNTETLTYLGQTVNYTSLDLVKHSKHLETIDESSDIRYQYYVVPSKFNGALFVNTFGKQLSQHELYYGSSIKAVIEKRENEADRYTVVFWIMWIIVTIGGVIYFYYLDNDWLNGGK